MGKRVLVVDDDDGVRVALTLALSSRGHTVTSASNGKEALEKLEKANPEVIISDVLMPVMDGVELTLHLRGDRGYLNPLILMSGHLKHREVDVYDFLHRGVVDRLLYKPFAVAEVFATVEA